MNSVLVSPRRSLRLAHARMAKVSILPEPPKLAQESHTVEKSDSDNLSSKSDRFGRVTTDIPMESSNNIVLCSASEKGNLKFSIKRVPNSLSEIEATLGARPLIQERLPSFEEIKKRVKSSNLASYFEDTSKFSLPEITVFEQVYSNMLFDNTISYGPDKQADIGGLERRKFKSYRAGDFADGLSGRSKEFKMRAAEVRALLPLFVLPVATDSRIIGFLRLIRRREDFTKLLNEDLILVIQFFQEIAWRQGENDD